MFDGRSVLLSGGSGVGVHYIPVHLHPFYRRRFGTAPGDCPAAEAAYEEILSLPIFPAMTDHDVADVVEAVLETRSQQDTAPLTPDS